MITKTHKIDIIVDVHDIYVPNITKINNWATLIINQLATNKNQLYDLCITIVPATMMNDFNLQYRGIDKPTNVLAFPSQVPIMKPCDFVKLGDLLLCAEIINTEYKNYNQNKEAYWGHILTHGILHLFGYDHNNDCNEQKMIQAEKNIITLLGFSNYNFW